MSNSESIPDVVGTLTGYRVWPILKSDLGYVLGSYHDNFIWIPGQPTKASCNELMAERVAETYGEIVRGPCQVAPNPSCSCGLYGAITPKEAVNNLVQYFLTPAQDTEFIAYGRVDLWGRVVEHEYAYRAEFAYPKEISVVSTDFEMARTPATDDIGLYFKGEPEARRIAESISSLYKIPAAPISSGDEAYEIIKSELNTIDPLGKEVSMVKQVMAYRAWHDQARITHARITKNLIDHINSLNSTLTRSPFVIGVDPAVGKDWSVKAMYLMDDAKKGFMRFLGFSPV